MQNMFLEVDYVLSQNAEENAGDSQIEVTARALKMELTHQQTSLPLAYD